MDWSLLHAPDKRPHLQNNQVHIWRSSLNLPEAQLLKLGEILSRDELRRGEKYYFRQDRRHFIAARGILRKILSRYLDIDPVAIKFSYSPNGKPFLSNSFDCERRLSFNISHAHDLALYAFTLDRKVGVDLEYIRKDLDWNGIVGRFFSTKEKLKLRKTPESIRCEKFFTFWTRKEALLKAMGVGLFSELTDVDVSMRQGQSVRVITSNQGGGGSESWSLCDLDPGFGYAAALAVEDRGFALQCWQW